MTGHGTGLWLAALLLLAASPARAGDEEEGGSWLADSEVDANLHGDVKTFFVAAFPYQWFVLPEEAGPLLDLMGMTEDEAMDAFGLTADPMGQGSANLRLKLDASYKDRVRLEAHWALTTSSAMEASLVPGMSTGAGLTAPEAWDLTWTPDTGSAMTVQGRFDWLMLSAKLPHVDVTVGRQPISFGTGYFFTPMDLVNPFHPATIDTEYKPGVDAIRVDAYAGISTKFTLAAAYAGDELLVGEDRRDDGELVEDLVLAASGQGTVGVTDLIGFAGLVHGEPVFGIGTISAIRALGVHAEATVTLREDDDPFVRAVGGVDWRPTGTTYVMAEAYVQTLGAGKPCNYLEMVEDERFARGELWQMGRIYGAVSVNQEITPLIVANAAFIGNLADPSGLAVLGLSWSVADNATLGVGSYLGVGERPDEVALPLITDPTTGMPTLGAPTDRALSQSIHSEFGLYPQAAFLQVKTYF